MTDDEVEIFLTLKFSSKDEIVAAFKASIGCSPWFDTSKADPNIVMAAICFWTEQGAPERLVIPSTHAELFLKLRFLTVDKAYDYVMSRPPGEHHGLSDAEILAVMDYVKPPNN